MYLEIASISENESFARVAVGAFISQLNPTMDELMEVKTVVSEVVTNSIIHGYNEEPNHTIEISCQLYDGEFDLIITDYGKGIEDIEMAREPMYTSKPELERSGMGFTIIENFMDSVEIESSVGKGTSIHMTKMLSSKKTKVVHE